MGEMVGISIGEYDFISCKNTFGDLLTIYSPDDRRLKPAVYEDGEEYVQYQYVTTVERAKRALDCLGHTITAAKASFERSKQEEIDFREYVNDANEINDESVVNEFRKKFLFEDWCKAIQKFSQILSKDKYSYATHKYKLLEAQRKRKKLSFGVCQVKCANA